ncbi:PREDICTED: sodium channel protein Nach-like [Dufourea novaeangliae]|uniref:sodium channel protein Nach-like n=1 Tax=Dufourea novaeangliae TaxID=178035 RepID=UPI00076779E4|nr:PREDICTED: sodium channel protein Nach-like [Dufourea novaeangliae]
MSKRFVDKDQEIVYFNDTYKKSFGKTIPIVDAKHINKIDSRKKTKHVPTSRDVLNDFLESTSIHGLQYFGKIDIKVGTFGKILWTCTMLTGFLCLSLMVMQFLQRYNDNPTNTYVRSFYNPIFKAPFPAVTICPFSPISLQRRLKIVDGINIPENMTEESVLNLLKYSHHITLPFTMKKYDEIKELKALLDANQWTVSNFLKILKPCEDVTNSCWWSGERIDCDQSIKISHTSYGLCCSFNYLLEEYVGREKQVLVHHSMDFPGLNTKAYILQKDRQFEIGIQPTMIEKPVGLYHLNKEKKVVPVCIPDSANTLDYFPTYRYSNCYANCRIRRMIQICGCLPFIYDHLTDYYHIKPCEIDGLACIQDNSMDLSIVSDINTANFTCSCRTPCEDVNYEASTNSVVLMKTQSSASYNNQTTGRAILKIFMHSQVFMSMETLAAADEVYLLASIGGIFSLFLGCSFLSLVEILYFIVIFGRATYSRRKTKKRRKKTKWIT